MSNLSKVTIWIALLSIVFLCGCIDYVYNNIKWYPPNIPVNFKFDPVIPSNWAFQIATAAGVWTAENTSFSFGSGISQNSTNKGAPVRDNTNTITLGNLGPGDGVLATAYRWNTSGTDHIVECDMVFNSNTQWSADPNTCPPDKFDVQNAAAHEFGHWLSLGDVHDPHTAVTMYFGTYPGEIQKRDLAWSDQAGIKFIYP
jgi:hypothetical protein